MNNRLPLRDLNKQFVTPERIQSMLTKVSTGWIYHTRDIYRCYVQDWILNLQDSVRLKHSVK